MTLRLVVYWIVTRNVIYEICSLEAVSFNSLTPTMIIGHDKDYLKMIYFVFNHMYRVMKD